MLIPRGGGRGSILLGPSGLWGLLGLWGFLGLWGLWGLLGPRGLWRPGIGAFPDTARGEVARDLAQTQPRAAHWLSLMIALRVGLSSIPRIGLKRPSTAEVSAHA